MSEEHDRYREWDAAYVLGSLSPEDRRAFERHLTTCAVCTNAVGELAGLPGILSKLPSASALALGSEPDHAHLRAAQHEAGFVQKLAVAAARRRRRDRVTMAGILFAAAAALTVGGFYLGTTIAPAATPAGTVLAMDPVKPGIMTAELQITDKAWGTRLDWTCTYLAGDNAAITATGYDMVITDSAGMETIVASWGSGTSRAGGLAAASSVPTSDIRSIEIRAADTDIALVRTHL